MPFIILVAFVAFSVAAAAAYFSVYGLALIFSGAVIPVIIMASTLEVGKLCATSILYNHWHRLGILMRSYYVIAIFVLMLITSGGIYGFLSAAYQQDQLPLEKINQRIELLDNEFERKAERLAQMDLIIASIGANFISKRLEEKEQQSEERASLSARLEVIEQERLDISNARIEQQAHIGPVIYMAEVFGTSTDQATNIIILLFIFVFDPLAVALTVSVNMLWKARKEEQNIEVEQPQSDSNPDKEIGTITDQPSPNTDENIHVLSTVLDEKLTMPLVTKTQHVQPTKIKPEPIHLSIDDTSELVGTVESQETPAAPRFDPTEFIEMITKVQPIHESVFMDLLAATKQSEEKVAEIVNTGIASIKNAVADSINENNAKQPVQTPILQPTVTPESHDRVDAKLERRRNLVKDIRKIQ